LPLASIDLELPGGLSITAGFSTIHLKDVVALAKSSFEVELGGFATLPDVSLDRLHHFAIEHADTT
jgi:hypothetical protein